MSDLTRRSLIWLSAALSTAWLAPRQAAARLAPTAGQTEGPFYPDKLPADTDNDLVKIEGAVKEAGGEILRLSGRVVTRDGAPVAGALVEIWQCDANGRYAHSGDWGRAKRDANFQGYGRMRTDADGRYYFRTIKPVAYPGRTPHIHFKAHYPDGRVLTTQMYVAGDARNARDGLYLDLSPVERKTITVALDKSASGAEWAGDFEIVLA